MQSYFIFENIDDHFPSSGPQPRAAFVEMHLDALTPGHDQRKVKNRHARLLDEVGHQGVVENGHAVVSSWCPSWSTAGARFSSRRQRRIAKGLSTRTAATSFAFCDRTVENASVLKTYLRGDACFLNDLNDAAEAVKMALVYAEKYHKNVTPIPLTMHYLEKTSYVLNNYDRFPDSLLSLLQLLPFRIFGYVLVDMPLHATRLSLDLAKQAAESEARSDSMEYFLKKAAEKLKTIDTVDPTAHIITKKINRDDTFEIGSTRNPLRKARLWPNTRSKIDPGWLHSYDYTGMFF